MYKIALFKDTTFPLQLAGIADIVRNMCSEISVNSHEIAVHIPDMSIQSGKSYAKIAPEVERASESFDKVVLCTNVQYDSNYFHDFQGNVGVLSFFGWNVLTDLPLSNGLLYFVAEISARMSGIATHNISRGCVGDFLWDKTGIDLCMRNGYLCYECEQRITRSELIPDIQSIISLVKRASHSGADVMSMSTGNPRNFDIFMAYNNNDKPEVRRVRDLLQAKGLRTWLDEDQMIAGRPWQDQLEDQIATIGAAAILVGQNGMGPWEDLEVRAFITQFMRRGCPVIPIILPECSRVPNLPIFLQQFHWVDLRQNSGVGIDKIVAGARS